MFIELVDALRCLTAHDDSWLVAASRRMAGRSIVDGTLGCPVCRREYPVVGGVAYFGVDAEEPSAGRDAAAVAAGVGGGDDALRLAALLGLDTPHGTVVLAGGWARLAPALRELTSVRCLLLDPLGSWAGRGDEGTSVIRAGGAVPLAAGAVRGVALDAATSAPGTVRAAARALVPGGRLVAPAAAEVPEGISALARDASVWVGERLAAPSAPVPIGRRPPQR